MGVRILGYLFARRQHADACGGRMNDDPRIDLLTTQAPRGSWARRVNKHPRRL